MSEKTYNTEIIGIEFDINNETYCQATVLILWGQERLTCRISTLIAYSKETHESGRIDPGDYEVASERAILIAMKHIRTRYQEAVKA